MERKKTVTSAEMKEIERKAAEGGLSYYQMMENAGTAATGVIMEEESVCGKQALIFCGKGNNGGDGFVVARKLREAGANVRLFLVEGEPKTEDAIKNKKLCEDMSLVIMDSDAEEAADLAEGADFIVDAVYGTGFHGELREKARRAAQLINSSKAKVYALDMPSGVNSDDGTADPDTVAADTTIAFHRLKPAHTMPQSADYCGRLICADIGIRL